MHCDAAIRLNSVCRMKCYSTRLFTFCRVKWAIHCVTRDVRQLTYSQDRNCQCIFATVVKCFFYGA